MRVSIGIKHYQGEAVIRFSRYQADNSLAMILDTPRGECIAKATICLDEFGHRPQPGEVFIKDWSENEGMFKGLIDAGVIVDTGVSYEMQYPSHTIIAKVGSLTPAARNFAYGGF
jgi:hypothetical protein